MHQVIFQFKKTLQLVSTSDLQFTLEQIKLN
jgi:hypothetical protein